MNAKAKVSIIKVQNIGNSTIIEADVNIRGKTTRKRFIVPKGTLNSEIEKHIADRLNEEDRRNVVGKTFEVEL